MHNKNLPLVESAVVPDVYVSGLADIEPLGGGVYRFTFYTLQRSAITGKTERSICCRMICTVESAQQISRTAMLAVKTSEQGNEVIPLGMVAH